MAYSPRHHRERPDAEARRLGWIFATAVIAILPLLMRGNSCGHDFDFHLQSWLQSAQDWQHGLFYPHWVSAANYGAGEPRLVFYPPASWMLGALLGTLLPWKAAGGALTLVALAGSGFALYAVAREGMPRDLAAMAACVYIVNPYAMFVAYERTAFGELLAGIWIPLLLLYALRRPEPRDANLGFRGSWTGTVPLALVAAAVWLTNAPAAVMAFYTLAVVAIIAAVEERRLWPLMRAAAGGALGIALAAFYIVPAAYERRWVEIDRAISPGMRVEDSFLFGRTGEPFHDQVLHTASWIAVATMVGVAVAAVVAWPRFREAEVRPERLRARVWTPLIILPVLILVLMLPFSDFVWKHAPELMFLQFPWRWLLIASVSLAVLCAMAASRFLSKPAVPTEAAGSSVAGSNGEHRRTLLTGVGLFVVAGALIAAEQHLYWQPCDEEDMVSAQIAVFHGGGFEGTDEYVTRGTGTDNGDKDNEDTDNGAIQQGLPQVRVLAEVDADEADSSVAENPAWAPAPAPARPEDLSDDVSSKSARPLEPAGSLPTVKVQAWDAESEAFIVNTTAPGFAVLRLLDYPAWEVRVNGTEIPRRPHRVDGLMAIPLKAGTSMVEVHYAITRDVRWGRAISIAALVVLLLLVLRQRRTRR